MTEPTIPYEDPTWLVQYFATQQQCQPDEARWQVGHITVQQWVILLQHPHQVTEDALTALLTNIINYQNQGSGWADLTLRVRHWLRSLTALQQAFSMQHFFGAMAVQHPDNPAWRDGHLVAQRWYQLISQPHPEEIAVFLDEVDRMHQYYERQEFDWYDLMQMIRVWSTSRSD